MTTPSRTDASVRRLGHTLLRQCHAMTTWLATLPEEDFQRPIARQAQKRVIDCVFEVYVEATALTAALTHPSSGRPLAFPQLVRAAHTLAGNRRHADREALGTETGRSLLRLVEAEFDEAEILLNREVTPTLTTLVGPARLADVLRLLLMRLVGVVDEVQTAIPHTSTIPIDPSVWLETARGYATLVADQHPGRSIELRIPPAAAVQIGDGIATTTHTRGTPPSVVECSPATFVLLCHGKVTWQEAVARHLVDASGAHADLAHVFPCPA